MTHSFAQFAKSLSYEDLPEGVRATLRRSFMDTIGVGTFAATTEMAQKARKATFAGFGTGQSDGSRVLWDGRTTSPIGAAMAGAFAIDSVDAHDGTTPNKGHAGSAVFPALLAIADTPQCKKGSITGADLATWCALAYEISYRAGQVQHATVPDYHTSGSWTAVGVAAAATRAMDGTAEQIRHAAGIGEYHGPRSQMMRCIDHPSMLRDGVGWGAPSGVAAAFLALEGFTGAPALTCEGPEAAPFWNDLGDRWLLNDHTHYKRYPCCRWAHPAMDAAQDLMATHGLTHQQVEKIEIRTFHYATRLAGHRPKSQDELAYSIAFPVAAMVVRGMFGPGELTQETLHDPDILRLSMATDLIDDPELTARSVEKRWASVTLVTRDGTRLDSSARFPRGDRDAPLSAQEIQAKYHAFADPVLGQDASTELREMCAIFDRLTASEVGRLMDLLTRQSPLASAANWIHGR